MAAHFSRRMRHGATTTAVAAMAMAALTASGAAGVADPQHDDEREQASAGAWSPKDPSIDGDSSYHTELPPLKSPKPPSRNDPNGLPNGTGPTEAGVPATVLDAYRTAEAAVGRSDPGCNLPWQLLAAIGKVESGQARGGAVDADGTTLTPILGPVLDGNGFALIEDTDGGVYDGDPVHDRAVGPMQFIPSTWAKWGQDGNGDGEKDPNNIYDAALAAGHYLCAVGGDVSDKAHLDRAILGYNHSDAYLRTVLSWFAYYQQGAHRVPDHVGTPATGGGSGTGGAGHGADTPKNPGAGGSDQEHSHRPSTRPTKSEDGSVGPTATPTPTGSQTADPSPTGTADPTPTETGTPTPTETGSPTETGTPTPTETGTPTPTPTPTETDEPDPTPSECATATASPTNDGTAGGDRTPAPGKTAQRQGDDANESESPTPTDTPCEPEEESDDQHGDAEPTPTPTATLAHALATAATTLLRH